MSQNEQSGLLAGPGIMLLSAAIFGYFGFTMQWTHHDATTGQLVPFVPILEYTLKITCIAFSVAGLLAFAKPKPANLIYSAVGLLSSLAFVVVAIMDWMDSAHAVMSPILLLIFAAWNGLGSWSGLKAVRAS